MRVTAADLRRASTIAGIALLAVGVLGGFGYLVGVERLVVEGDAAETASNIAASETLFRVAVASLLAAAALDVVVAWALVTVFQPVSIRLSILAALFRVVYAAIFVVAIAELAGVSRLLSEADAQSDAILAGVLAYEDIWSAGLALFGGHLVLLGVLVWRAAYAPTVVGILLAVAGLGYGVDAFADVLFAGYEVELTTFTFVGEVVLIFWLLLRGRRVGDEHVARAEPG